ncbi:hypothetical protein B0T22DRAFT_516383 [Podospora appendiculata]|uniref:Rhodopsin domain-containing protein n=1 Tax=Podospora appendiculata TaxID=314037 RepID=A0AAE1C6S7_9PEZI|nr:hypothetical protein B0T22DRAFT_516383 [Podospora appendiculata]
MNSTQQGAIVGSGPPPPGVTPNFVDPESIASHLIIVAVVFPVATACLLGLRLYTALFIVKRRHLDDYFIVAAFASAVVNSIINIIQTKNGVGLHMWDVPFTSFKAFMKLGAIGGASTFSLSTLLTKISILLFYLRFSVDRAFRSAVYVVMLVVVGYTVPMGLGSLYQCQPMEKYWDFTVPGTCMNIQALYDATKIGVLLILMAGGFISTMRTVAVFVGAADTDLTWHYVNNLIWFIVEMYVGIICACLPCLKPFIRCHFPCILGICAGVDDGPVGSSLSLSVPIDNAAAGNEMVELLLHLGAAVDGPNSARHAESWPLFHVLALNPAEGTDDTLTTVQILLGHHASMTTDGPCSAMFAYLKQIMDWCQEEDGAKWVVPKGWLEIARLLLDRGAAAGASDDLWREMFLKASRGGLRVSGELLAWMFIYFHDRDGWLVTEELGAVPCQARRPGGGGHRVGGGLGVRAGRAG